MDDYIEWRGSVARGDTVQASVKRGEELLTLTGTLPPPREYDAFPHEIKSGAVRARRLGNTFEINTSRVSELTVYLHPDMIRRDQPVIVKANGTVVFDRIIDDDDALMLREFTKTRDRRLLWVNRIIVKL